MNSRKMTALFLTLAMVLSLSLTAFAADGDNQDYYNSGSTEIDGDVEYVFNDDKFSVELPTSNTTAFDFIIDPQGVLYDTREDNDAFYVIGDKTMYFTNDSANYYDHQEYYNTHKDVLQYYSSAVSETSDKLTVINKSSFQVDVTVSANVDEINWGNVALSEDSSFTGITGAGMYLAMIDSDSDQVAFYQGGVNKIDGTIGFLPNAYKVQKGDWDTQGYYYTYDLDPDLDQNKFYDYTYSFQMTGACNTDDAWTSLGSFDPKLEIEWRVEKHLNGTAPSSTPLTVEVTGNGSADFTVDLQSKGLTLGTLDLKATGIKAIEYPAGTYESNKYVTANGTVITLTALGAKNIATGLITDYSCTIVLDDIKETRVTVNFVPATP